MDTKTILINLCRDLNHKEAVAPLCKKIVVDNWLTKADDLRHVPRSHFEHWGVPLKLIDEIYDYLFVKSFVKIGIVFWKKGDENTIDRYGPNGVSKLVKNISSKSIIIQSGFIYHYAFAMLIGLVVLLTWLLMDYGL